MGAETHDRGRVHQSCGRCRLAPAVNHQLTTNPSPIPHKSTRKKLWTEIALTKNRRAQRSLAGRPAHRSQCLEVVWQAGRPPSRCEAPCLSLLRQASRPAGRCTGPLPEASEASPESDRPQHTCCMGSQAGSRQANRQLGGSPSEILAEGLDANREAGRSTGRCMRHSSRIWVGLPSAGDFRFTLSVVCCQHPRDPLCYYCLHEVQRCRRDARGSVVVAGC